MPKNKIPYRLDRTVFKKQSFEEASDQTSYWRQQNPEERFKAAYYLICLAYGFDWNRPPRLDRTIFSMRSHES